MLYEIKDIDSVISRDTSYHKKSKRFLSLLTKIQPQMASWITSNEDRLFVLYELFPLIGMYLQEKDSKNVLVIGIDRENVFDKVMLQNKNISFYGLDKIQYSDFKYPIDWAGMFFCDLTRNVPKEIKFDCIVDYGVIGWHKIHDALSASEITTYFDNIKRILAQNGLYFLKIDFHKPSVKTDYVLKIVREKFFLASFWGIEETVIYRKNKKMYHCYVLQANDVD